MVSLYPCFPLSNFSAPANPVAVLSVQPILGLPPLLDGGFPGFDGGDDAMIINT